MALIRGISFDFDGSLSLKGCDDILAANEPLLEDIKASEHLYKKTHVFINSNRQSVTDDNVNSGMNNNGSCYRRIQELSAELKAKFHDILLSDIYNDLVAGETFKQALTLLDDEQKDYVQARIRETRTPGSLHRTPDWLHDTSKLSILLAQVHILASEHPEDDIEFYFHDDRQDILDGLNTFFSNPQNRLLLPKNLKALYLCPHPQIKKESVNTTEKSEVVLKDKAVEKPKMGDELLIPINEENTHSTSQGNAPLEDYISYPPIVGEGEIRFDYRQMIKTMAAVCIESKTFQAAYPTDQNTNPVKNYLQAEQGGFLLTAVMNFVHDYAFGVEPIFSPNPMPKQLRTLLSRDENLVSQTSMRSSENSAPVSDTVPPISHRGFFGTLTSRLPHPHFPKAAMKGKKEKEEKKKLKSSKPKHKKASLEKEKKSAHLETDSTGVNQTPNLSTPNGSFFSATRPSNATPTHSTLGNHRGKGT